MFQNHKTSVGFLAVLGLGAVLGLPALAQPELMLAASTGQTVTVASNGSVTFGGTCVSGVTCITTSVSAGSGTITWSGIIGPFGVSTSPITVTGTSSKPSPHLDLQAAVSTYSTGGTLTIEWSDTGFNTGSGTATMSETTSNSNNNIVGTVNIAFNSYVDNSNALFGMGTPVGTINAPPYGTQTLNGPGPGGNTYSMTEVETITMGQNARLYGNDDTLTVTPTPPGTTISKGDTATIGFWHNKNGQALINALGPGLVSWLTSNFPNLYGSYGLTNDASVAALFLNFFDVSGQKTQAQILATALACYATSSSMVGSSVAGSYGFNVTPGGICSDTINVGSDGSAIGLSNNTSYSVLFLLQRANALFPFTPAEANAFNDIFSNINQTGDIS